MIGLTSEIIDEVTLPDALHVAQQMSLHVLLHHNEVYWIALHSVAVYYVTVDTLSYNASCNTLGTLHHMP